MDLFENSTTAETSPIEGQEVETAEEMETQEGLEYEGEGQEILEEESDQEEFESDEEESPEQGQEELIAGKFKSQDDLIKAYKNLEREFHKSRQQPQQPQRQLNNDIDPTEIFLQQLQQDPFGTINFLVEEAVKERTAPIYEQQAESRLAQDIHSLGNEYNQVYTEEGLASLFSKVEEIVSEDFGGNENLLKNPSKRILKLAAQEVFGDSKAQLYKMAKEKGKKEAETIRKTKQGLGSPKNTKPKQTEKTAEEQLADLIVGAGYGGGLFGN